ncbi:MAG: hypothetical protein U0X58_11350 [Flavobacteriaceae bacterium]
MKNLAKLLTAQQSADKKRRLQLIKKVNSLNTSELDWALRSLLSKSKKNYIFNRMSNLKTYLIDRLEIESNNQLENSLSKLNFSENLLPITEIIITVEYKKSKKWGSNPTAETYVNGIGFLTSGSIGGCGYDKQSTAVAMVLNQIPQFMQSMYALKSKNVRIRNHELFGFGSGYGILPEFEGGVGVSCYDKIFNAIGYLFSTVTYGKSFTVFSVKKIENQTQKQKSHK